MSDEFKSEARFKFPVYDLAGFETEQDRRIEVEVKALLAHMKTRGRRKNAGDFTSFLCATLEFTARLIVAPEKAPGVTDADVVKSVDGLAANLVSRCHAIMAGKGPNERADA